MTWGGQCPDRDTKILLDSADEAARPTELCQWQYTNALIENTSESTTLEMEARPWMSQLKQTLKRFSF